MNKPSNVWTVTDARRRFYELVFAAAKESQIIAARAKVEYEGLPITNPALGRFEFESGCAAEARHPSSKGKR